MTNYKFIQSVLYAILRRQNRKPACALWPTSAKTAGGAIRLVPGVGGGGVLYPTVIGQNDWLRPRGIPRCSKLDVRNADQDAGRIGERD